MKSVLRLLIAAIINATPVVALADSGPITNYIAAIRAQDHSKPEDEKIVDVGTDFCPIIRAQYDVDDNGGMDVLLSTSGCRATFWSSSYGGLNTFEMAGRRWVIFMQIGGEWVVKKGNDYNLEIRLLDRQMRKVPIEFCTLGAIESNTCKWSRIENDYRGLY